MEKLLQLLNEYKQGKPFQFTGYDEEYGMFDTNLNAEGNTSLPEETIISKKFGFIQRLDNEGKIDYAKVEDICYRDVNLFFSNRDFFGRYKRLLMLLAIQNDPINFLVSILK